MIIFITFCHNLAWFDGIFIYISLVIWDVRISLEIIRKRKDLTGVKFSSCFYKCNRSIFFVSLIVVFLIDYIHINMKVVIIL